MSPEPVVRWHAFAVAVALVAAAILGSPIAALACGGVVTLIAWGLNVKYRHDVRKAANQALRRALSENPPERSTEDLRVPWHRERLDLIVAGDARSPLGSGLRRALRFSWPISSSRSQG